MVTLDQGGLGTRLGQRYGRPSRCPEAVEGAWSFAREPDMPGGGWRVVPDAHPHAIVHRLPGGRVRATVVGARSRWIDVDQREREWTVGVRLAPGTLTALTGEPAATFLDGSVRLDDAFGRAGADVTDRLAGAEDPDGALVLLVRWLAERLERARPVDWRVRSYLRSVDGDVAGPAAAAETMGVSDRSLRGVCAEWIGLSPKVVARIRRLHEGLSALVRDPGTTGAAAAVGAGYADQSHFIRDSHDLLGETPEAFRARGLLRERRAS